MKELKRDTSKKIVAGVLAGLAKYFDQDPLLVRIIFVLFAIFVVIIPAALIYIFMWIVIPPE